MGTQYLRGNRIQNVVHKLKGVSQKIKRCLIKGKKENEFVKGKRLRCCLFTLCETWVCNLGSIKESQDPGGPAAHHGTACGAQTGRGAMLNCSPTGLTCQGADRSGVSGRSGGTRARRHTTHPVNTNKRRASRV